VSPLFLLLFWNVESELPNSEERSTVDFWGDVGLPECFASRNDLLLSCEGISVLNHCKHFILIYSHNLYALSLTVMNTENGCMPFSHNTSVITRVCHNTSMITRVCHIEPLSAKLNENILPEHFSFIGTCEGI
jgi:hypothetical protein